MLHILIFNYSCATGGSDPASYTINLGASPRLRQCAVWLHVMAQATMNSFMLMPSPCAFAMRKSTSATTSSRRTTLDMPASKLR